MASEMLFYQVGNPDYLKTVLLQEWTGEVNTVTAKEGQYSDKETTI